MRIVVLALLAAAASAALPALNKPVNFYALTLPTDPNNSTYGIGGCGFYYDTTTMILQGVCNWVMPDLCVGAHIHGPLQDGQTSAPVIFPLAAASVTNPLSPLTYTGSAALTNAEEADLFEGNYYVNIHSTQYQAGALRGPLVNAASLTTTPFPSSMATLDGVQAGTGSTFMGGSCIVKIGADTWLIVIHNIPELNLASPGCHIHGPSSGPGNATGVLYPIGGDASTCKSPIMVKNPVFNAQTQTYINAGLTYVNMHTVLHNNGEIRGQLNPIWTQATPVRGAASSITVSFATILLAAAAAIWGRSL
jgi:hypothetical protein